MYHVQSEIYPTVLNSWIIIFFKYKNRFTSYIIYCDIYSIIIWLHDCKKYDSDYDYDHNVID